MDKKKVLSIAAEVALCKAAASGGKKQNTWVQIWVRAAIDPFLNLSG